MQNCLLNPIRREAKRVGNSVNYCSVLHEERGAAEGGENKMKHLVFQHFPSRTALLNSVDFLEASLSSDHLNYQDVLQKLYIKSHNTVDQ